MQMQDIIDKAMGTMDGMPKCENCGGHLAGGAITFTSKKGVPKIWCMKCVFEGLSYYDEQKQSRLYSK